MNRLKLLLVVAGVAGLAAVVSAALLGVPVGLVPPLVNFQNLNDGSTGALSPAALVFDGTNLTIDATPSNIDFGSGPELFNASPTPTLHIQLKINSPDGSTYTGTAGDDFTMTGSVDSYTSPLLTGKLLQFGFLNRTGAPSSAPDAMDFRFRVTGGSLASQFAGQDLGVTVVMEADTWADGAAFGSPFTANVKGQLSPIPGCTGSIGDYVWFDNNNNGIQDDGPGGTGPGAGISGAVVTLTDSVGNLIPTVGGPNPYTTGGDGKYLFSNLCGGNYKVTVTNIPAGYTPTTSNAPGSTTANDSNGSPYSFSLPNNTTDLTIDFGYVPPTQACTVKIGDFVWYDLDLDGIQDASEPGLDGWTVNLLSNGNVFATTTTGVNPSDSTKHGYYSFTVPCGTYTVQLVMKSGYALTLTNAGSDQTLDSNTNPSATTPTNLATNGSQDVTIDFGVVNEQDYCPPAGDNTANGKAGKLYWTVAANGDVTFRYDQDTGLNDNSYGTNQVGWGANSISGKSHKFSDLVGSDKAEFIFTNAGGTKVLDFYMDYISLKSGTPSGYGNQGTNTCTGCDGSLVTGTAAWIQSTNSSMAHNLNDTNYCAGGSCNLSGTDLLINSPPTTSSTSYTLPAGSPYTKWNFTDSFEGKISGAAFGGSSAGFGGITLGLVHNSPSKSSVDAITPPICGNGGGGGTCNLSITSRVVATREVQLTIQNNGTADAVISSLTLTFPASNGNLLTVKLDADTVYNNPTGVASGGTITAFTGTTLQRSIQAGTSDVLHLVFKNTADTDLTQYDGTFTFGSCSVNFQAANFCALGYKFGTAPALSATDFNESSVLQSWDADTNTVHLFASDEHAPLIGVKTSSHPTVTTMGASNPAHAGGSPFLDVGDQTVLDPSNRPIFPAVFLTDITGVSDNAGHTSQAYRLGDWQFGGKPQVPTDIFGTWKSATKSGTTLVTDGDPTKNTSFGPGADTPPTTITNLGYITEVRWSLNGLPARNQDGTYSAVQSGHMYRVQFMVHDGDQNQTGGDVGQACMLVTIK